MNNERFPAKEFPQMTQERLILRVNRVLCRLKIAEEQTKYLMKLIQDRVPESVLFDIERKLYEIYEKHDDVYNNTTNEQVIADYPRESSFQIFISD